MNVLHVMADPLKTDQSTNKKMARYFLSQLENCSLNSIDLIATPPPFLNQSLIEEIWQSKKNLSLNESPRHYQYMHQLKQNFLSAELLLISAPIWNNYVPGILKTWLDLLISPAVTFKYGHERRVPTHSIQRVILLLSAGGLLSRSHGKNALSQIITAPFRYIEIEQIDTIWALGQEPNVYPDFQDRLAAAFKKIDHLANTVTNKDNR